jgi:hypothetical protein
VNNRRLCNEVKETAACLHFCLEYTSDNLGVCHVQDHIPVFLRRVWSHRVWSAPEMYSAFNLGRAYQLGRWHAVYEMSMFSRQERKTTDSILVYYSSFPNLLDEIHGAYEYRYIDGCSDDR